MIRRNEIGNQESNTEQRVMLAAGGFGFGSVFGSTTFTSGGTTTVSETSSSSSGEGSVGIGSITTVGDGETVVDGVSGDPALVSSFLSSLFG